MALAAFLDTGPLVAFFNKRDYWHNWAVAAISTRSKPLITCDSVLSETLFLVKNNPAVVRALKSMMDEGILDVRPVLSEKSNTVLDDVLRYCDLPGSLADLSLIYLYQQESNGIIITLDSDFRVYSDRKGKPIKLVIPT